MAAVKSYKVIGITGSLRKASCNTGILRAAAPFMRQGSSFELFVPNLPLMNADMGGSPPDEVTQWRELAKSADMFIFATCEHNFSVSAAMKNAIDWASQGPLGNCFADKPALVMGAGGGVGSLRAQQHLRDIALFLNLHIMNTPGVTLQIYNEPKPFDLSTGDLTNPDKIAEVGKAVDALFVWADRLGPK